MNSSQIRRVVDLIKRTGDRCVIMDNESDEVLTMMRLGDYEKLLDSSWGEPIEDLSEREMMDKVNRDIAYWKSCQEDGEKEAGCCCADCGHDSALADKAEEADDLDDEDLSEVSDAADFDDFKDEDFVEDEKKLHEPTVEQIPIEEKGLETIPVQQNIMTEKLDDLPEEEADTFLLEPV